MPRFYTRYIKIFLLCLLATFCLTATAAPAKNKTFVVVIDAGHGGKDNGATEGRYVEKDINLAVALKLQEILKKKKNFKVILTRNSDKFISLADRASKANKENADLFISIHANSLDISNPERSKIQGSTVFVQGENGSEHAESVADMENDAASLEKNAAYDVQVKMTGDQNVINNSLGFAGEVQRELVKTAKRIDRGVQEADFFVLRETEMPSVLIEMDFISNQNSALYLNSSTGQKRIAQAIANAIVTYRNNIDKKGNAAYGSPTEADDNPDVFVLVSDTQRSNRQIDAAPHNSTIGSSRATSVRKRRNAESRRVSSQRNLETDYIAVRSEIATPSVTSAKASQANTSLNTVAPSQGTDKKVSASFANKKQKTSEKVNEKRSETTSVKKTNNKQNKTKEKATKSDENVRIFDNKMVRVSAASPDNPRSLKAGKKTSDTKIQPTVSQTSKASSQASPAKETKAKSKPTQPERAKTAKPKQSIVKKEVAVNKSDSKNETKAKSKTQSSSKTNIAESSDSNADYEAAKQKALDKDKSAPKSLKSKKRN